MPFRDPEASKADEYFSASFGGRGFQMNSPVAITVGPYAEQNILEDPVMAQKQARARYEADMRSRGLQEDEDGNVSDIYKLAEKKPPPPPGLPKLLPPHAKPVDTPDAAEGSESDNSSVVDAQKKKVSAKALVSSLMKLRGKKEEEETRGRASIEETDPGAPPVTKANVTLRMPYDKYDQQKVAATKTAPAPVFDPDEEKELTKEHDINAPHDTDVDPEREPEFDITTSQPSEKKAAPAQRGEAGALALSLVGLPGSEVGDWLWDLADAGAARLLELAGNQASASAATIAAARVMELDPNPFTLTQYMTSLIGAEWLTWEPETIAREVVRRTGRTPPAMDRILALKLVHNRPTLFYEKFAVAEKISTALVDRIISPGELEPPPPEWLAVAFAVLRSLRAPDAKEPVLGDDVVVYIAACLREGGYVMAPTLLMAVDPVLGEEVDNEPLRDQVLTGYIQALRTGPLDAEDEVSVQINRLLSCHVLPLRILAET